jgi:hypothetical protein
MSKPKKVNIACPVIKPKKKKNPKIILKEVINTFNYEGDHIGKW